MKTTVRTSPDSSPFTAADNEASAFSGSPEHARWGLGRFRRVTSSGRFIPEIDGLRFVAIFSVYCYHLSGYLQEKGAPFAAGSDRGFLVRALEHGNYGVQLFFIISGFILGLPFASHYLRGAKPVSLRAYFLRRLTRLEPPYIASMLLFFALLVVYVGQNAATLLPHLVASLLYVHNLVYGNASAINAVAWSLEVEIQFYVLVPLLARLFAIRSRAARRGTLVAIIAAALVCQTLAGQSFRFERSILGQIQFFLTGFLLADIYVCEWRSTPPSHRFWDLVALVGWPLLFLLWRFPSAIHWLFAPLALALYCAAFCGVTARKIFANRWITTIGGMCYTIYLLHYQVISFAGSRTLRFRVSDDFTTTFFWQFALITPVVLLVCAVFFAAIEKPCMRPNWPSRLMARLRAPFPASTSA